MIHGQIKPLFNTPINWGHPLAQGLVASYLMNEGMGDLVHDSCGMNDGRTSGMAPFSGTSGWVPGPHGAALAFDGSNDYVNCVNGPNFNFGAGEFTIIANIQALTPFFSYPAILDKGGNGDWTAQAGGPGFILFRWNATQYRFRMSDNSATCDQLVFTNVVENAGPIQIAVVVKLSTITGFVNGVAHTGTARTAASDGSIDSVNNLNIGRWRSYERAFNGLISSLSIYNRALSAQEIAYLYAFPWCMYDRVDAAWAQKDYGREARLANYYQQMRAA